MDSGLVRGGHVEDLLSADSWSPMAGVDEVLEMPDRRRPRHAEQLARFGRGHPTGPVDVLDEALGSRGGARPGSGSRSGPPRMSRRLSVRTGEADRTASS
jgi:hypothetical protein